MKTLRRPGRKLQAQLHAHKMWLAGSMKFRPLDIRGGDFSFMDLSNRDLRGANFSRANFEGADLRGCKLMGCNFSGANLHTVKLAKADMRHAVLNRSFCAFVAFKDVSLAGVDFTGADLQGVNWTGANFGDDAESKMFMAKACIVPEGDIIGWKRLRGGKLAKLRIPKEAKRSNGFGRRCRAEFVEVLMIVDEGGEPHWEGVSKRDAKLKYRAKEIVRPDGYDPDWKNECAQGINFFITREEAEAYG